MGLYHNILNVNKDASIEEIKKSYKSLCKIYHPDKSNEDSTEKMALINEAYYYLTKQSVKVNEEISGVGDSNNLTKYKDQAYSFYKQGLKLYDETDLNMSTGNHYFPNKRKSMFADKEYIEIINKKIILSLYYFNIVCMQYPESPWVSDSIEKMKKLNQRKMILNKR